MTTTDVVPVLVEDTLRSALSTGARPPRPSPLSASLSFAWRAMLKIKHVPMQLFDVVRVDGSGQEEPGPYRDSA